MSNRDINRRQRGLDLVSSATKVMAVGAVGMTGAVAVLADHIYNVQHSAAASQTTTSQSVSATSSDDGSGDGSLQTISAPSASSSGGTSSGSTSSGSTSSVVSGGS